MFAADFGDGPLPEREGFGVRVVDPENANPLADPETENVAQLPPQPLPVRRFEIEGNDVLVFFRRIFGILDCAVGAPAKPARLVAHVGVVGGGLEGDIHGDLDAVFAGGGDEVREILQRPQLGMHLLVAAVGSADRPGAPRIIRAGLGVVVLPLAMGQADGVDRRKVDDVEAHAGNFRQELLAVGEGAVRAPCRAGGAGKEFVPGAEQRLFPLDADRQLPLEVGDQDRIVMDRHQLRQLLLAGQSEGRRFIRRFPQARSRISAAAAHRRRGRAPPLPQSFARR